MHYYLYCNNITGRCIENWLTRQKMKVPVERTNKRELNVNVYTWKSNKYHFYSIPSMLDFDIFLAINSIIGIPV